MELLTTADDSSFPLSDTSRFFHHPCRSRGILLFQGKPQGLDVVRPLPLGLFQRDAGMALFLSLRQQAFVLQ